MWISKTGKTLLVLVLCFCCLLPFDARAYQTVTSEDLYRDIQHQSEQREQNLAIIQQFISDPVVRGLIAQKGADYGKVQQALPQLNDQELAQLATQVQTAEANFAGGYDETVRLLIIVLLVVAIVVLIVSVAD
jgi:formylmethanofuran dehydrogenase subunit E-like metal-binding protein